ncbi:MAG: 16S rRNA (cytidine(1402)-2'-O)-methyltransferase [Parcubacteria group bacterium]|nr:16S rRNA (cytidine(1402)-2'-O)-methyltransferase [Parcubacteria group bacterium]|tara:strand:+ start:260 stop:949 length:690 start_codon:yes stop_codon:yes gene_type:complete
MENGTLYIVATPIGNLEDITLRALRILGEADVIFCEDTRVTRRLCEKYEITTHLKSLNARTESVKIDEVLSHLENGESVAYVSDAGTPTVSDPGSQLVARVREQNFSVEVIPGASAVTAALSITGVPASEFTFLGFLPHKKGRQMQLKRIADPSADGKRTVVLYESTHRIVKLLEELTQHIGERKVCIARELTKIYEEMLCGTAEELKKRIIDTPEKQKGEFVVIVASF